MRKEEKKSDNYGDNVLASPINLQTLSLNIIEPIKDLLRGFIATAPSNTSNVTAAIWARLVLRAQAD